jgi:hypothetical protein
MVRLELEYEGVEATRVLSERLLCVGITERFNEQLSEARLVFEDSDGRWRGSWFPKAEERLRLKLGNSEQVRDFGLYRIYEVNYTGDRSGERIEILAVSGTERLYEKRWASYRQQPLKAVVETVAGRHGLRVVGEIGGTLAFEAQRNESDMAFLHRLAKRYGYVMKMEGSELIFTSHSQIDDSPSVATIRRGDVKSYQFSDKAIGTYKRCVVRGFNAKTRQVLEGTAGTGEPVLYAVESGIDSTSEATERAREHLKETNRKKTHCELTLPGDSRLLSGMTIELNGFGVFDGKYVVEQTQHRVERSGYETSLEGVRT